MAQGTAIRELLVDRLAELTARTERIEADFRAPLDDDSAEQAIDREDDEPLNAIEHAALGEIADIRAALARLDQGRYGLCTTCGEPIDRKRLVAMPAAIECIVCAKTRSARTIQVGAHCGD